LPTQPHKTGNLGVLICEIHLYLSICICSYSCIGGYIHMYVLAAHVTDCCRREHFIF